MKDLIIELNKQGKSNTDIGKTLGIATVTVWRTLYPEANKKNRLNEKLERNGRKRLAKERLGNKCSICGYCKSLNALDLHHKDESLKSLKLKKVRDWRKLTKPEFEHELTLCELVCKNCHSEIHDKALNL